MWEKSGGSGCDSVIFPESNGLEYNKVCGRIWAYQFGTPDSSSSFLSVHSGSSVTFNNFIWLFSLGITQSQVNSSLVNDRCPCDGGSPFNSAFREIHFCESQIKDNTPRTKYNNHFLAKMYSGMMLAVLHLEIVVQGLLVRISYDILSMTTDPTSVLRMTSQLRISPLNSLKYM